MNSYTPSPQEEERWRNFVAEELRDHKSRFSAMEATLSQVNATVGRIMESVMLLARMEEREKVVQARLMQGKIDMDDFEKRISAMERDMPALKESRKWVVGGVLAGICLMLAAVANQVLRT